MAMVSADGSSQPFGGLTAQIVWFGLRVGGHPALVKWTGWTLSQWLCHDDSTINIVVVIIIIKCIIIIVIMVIIGGLCLPLGSIHSGRTSEGCNLSYWKLCIGIHDTSLGLFSYLFRCQASVICFSKCWCGQNHIMESCPLTKLAHHGLLQLHSDDDNAVTWLRVAAHSAIGHSLSPDPLSGTRFQMSSEIQAVLSKLFDSHWKHFRSGCINVPSALAVYTIHSFVHSVFCYVAGLWNSTSICGFPSFLISYCSFHFWIICWGCEVTQHL